MGLHVRRALVFAFAWLALGATVAWAQTGAIVGRVTSESGMAPIASALVEAQTADGRTAGTAITDGDGRYRMIGVPAGTYTVLFSAVGHTDRRVQNVIVAAGETAIADASLAVQAFDLDPVQVTASRGTIQKAVDAPAHVEVRGEQDRKSTRLNSSHVRISYAVFCLKKKKK